MPALTADLSDAFFTSGDAMAGRLSLSFVHLLFVMNFESAGIRASAQNPSSGAVGLIQILSLPGVGFSGTSDDFKALSAEAQLPYVEAFLRPYAGKRLDSAARIEQALLGPATLDDPSGLVYAASGTRWNGQEASYYQGNKAAFDPSGKGTITVDDLQRALLAAAKSARFSEAAQRYASLTGKPLVGPGVPASAPKAVAWAVGLAAAFGATVLLAGGLSDRHASSRRHQTA